MILMRLFDKDRLVYKTFDINAIERTATSLGVSPNDWATLDAYTYISWRNINLRLELCASGGSDQQTLEQLAEKNGSLLDMAKYHDKTFMDSIFRHNTYARRAMQDANSTLNKIRAQVRRTLKNKPNQGG